MEREEKWGEQKRGDKDKKGRKKALKMLHFTEEAKGNNGRCKGINFVLSECWGIKHPRRIVFGGCRGAKATAKIFF